MRLFNWARALLMVITAFVLYLFVGQLSNLNIETQKSEQIALNHLIFDSVSGISFMDANNRIHPGIIDMQKFSSENLDKSFSLPSRTGVEFILRPESGVEKKAYINKDEYILVSQFTNGIFKYKITEPVLIMENEKLSSGILEVSYAFKE